MSEGKQRGGLQLGTLVIIGLLAFGGLALIAATRWSTTGSAHTPSQIDPAESNPVPGCHVRSNASPDAGLSPSPSSPQDHVAAMIEDVAGATVRCYNAHDNRGDPLDTIKIIRDPEGGYLGVYHVQHAGRFTVKLATSKDLITWRYRVDLDDDASQPTITAVADGGFLVVSEVNRYDGAGAHLRFRYYEDRDALLDGEAQHQYDAPRTLSPCAEGTPNVYAIRLEPDIEHSTIDVGFHYYRDCNVDRAAQGTLTNFTTWTASVAEHLNTPLEQLGVHGNIGDRDSFTIDDVAFNVQEGLLGPGDWNSWRCFLYDWATGSYRVLTLRTDAGTTVCANPTATLITAPSGRSALLVTVFIPKEGSAEGERGQLVYYREFDTALSSAQAGLWRQPR